MQPISHIQYRQQKILYYLPSQQPYDRDIIPGLYEGGFKIWECTIDLINLMAQGKIQFEGKRVLDLGCGHGLLGICAIKSGATFCLFQDYNEDVIKKITVPNIELNAINQQSHCDFIWGDWDNMPVPQQKFDLILGSEVIYNQQNYLKVINICHKMLAPSGIAILANKHYYFGVGGGMEGFKDAIDQSSLQWESLHKIVPTKGGNKKEIISLRKKQN